MYDRTPVVLHAMCWGRAHGLGRYIHRLRHESHSCCVYTLDPSHQAKRGSTHARIALSDGLKKNKIKKNQTHCCCNNANHCNGQFQLFLSWSIMDTWWELSLVFLSQWPTASSEKEFLDRGNDAGMKERPLSIDTSILDDTFVGSRSPSQWLRRKFYINVQALPGKCSLGFHWSGLWRVWLLLHLQAAGKILLPYHPWLSCSVYANWRCGHWSRIMASWQRTL